MSERPPMRPADVIRAALTVYKDRWRDLLKATFFTVFPIVIFGLLIIATISPPAVLEALGISPEESKAAFDGLTADAKTTFLALSTLIGLVSAFAQTLAFGACLLIVLAHRDGTEKPYREAIRDAVRTFPSLLWITLLTLILTTLGNLLLIVPGIWVFVAWSLAPVALYAEGLKGRHAGLRSVELVKGSWWNVALVGIAVILAFLILETIVGAIFGAILSPITRDNAFGSFFARGLVSSGVWLVANGVHAAVVTVLFFDLRARKAVDQPSAVTT